MMIISTKIAIGTFLSYEKAKTALCDLKDGGFPMGHVSVLAQDAHHEITSVKSSLFLRDMDGLNIHSSIAIAGVKPVILAGAVTTTIAAAISEGYIGCSTVDCLVGGLIGLGLPADRARVYSDRVLQGDYLVVAEGIETEIDLVESIFRNRGICGWYVYSVLAGSVQATTPRSLYHSYV